MDGKEILRTSSGKNNFNQFLRYNSGSTPWSSSLTAAIFLKKFSHNDNFHNPVLNLYQNLELSPLSLHTCLPQSFVRPPDGTGPMEKIIAPTETGPTETGPTEPLEMLEITPITPVSPNLSESSNSLTISDTTPEILRASEPLNSIIQSFVSARCESPFEENSEWVLIKILAENT